MRLLRVLLILLLFPALLAGVAGWFVAPAFLHPTRRVLTPDLIREADAAFLHVGGRREDFNVRASDGSLLRGWKVRAANANGAWVLAFHGVGDNRIGVVNHSEILLRAGYSVVLMDRTMAKDVPVWNIALFTFPGFLPYRVPLRNSRSTPSLCEPIASTPGWVSISPVKRPRSASWSTRCQVFPASRETYIPPSRNVATRRSFVLSQLSRCPAGNPASRRSQRAPLFTD